MNFVLTVGIALYCVFAYETLEDLTENISVLATQIALASRFYILFVYKNKILDLIENVDRHFYMPGEEEKRMVMSTVKLTRQIGIGIFGLYVMTTVAMVSYPLTSDERVLPFKTWFPYADWTQTPYYEIIFAAQAILIILIGWFAGAMDGFIISMLLYCALQFKLVAHGLRKSQNIAELRTCIQYHQSVIE